MSPWKVQNGVEKEEFGEYREGARQGTEKSPDLGKLYPRGYWGQKNDIIFHPFHLVVHTVLSHLCLMTGFIHNLKSATSFFRIVYSLK